MNSGILAGGGNQACDGNTVIVGGASNIIANLAGKAAQSFIGAGFENTIRNGGTAFIGAGNMNSVSGDGAFLGAGFSNAESGRGSFLGAGEFNLINGTDGFVGAGTGDSAESDFAFIGAGRGNVITPVNDSGIAEHAGGLAGVIGGGRGNEIQALIANGAQYGAIGGGGGNKLTGTYAVIGGGSSNTAGGSYSAIPGGIDNGASGYASFAAGTHSLAAHAGTFVWSDSTNGATQLSSTGPNQFLVRASGGITFYTNGKLASGVRLPPGSGTWASLSDRASKTRVSQIDDAAVLEKVAALPVNEWSYRSEAGVRHLGPMAQDFYAAFGIGEDDRHITTIDEGGIALAAIKGLDAKAKVERADRTREVGRLEHELAERDILIGSLEARLDALTKKVEALRAENTR